MPTYLLDTSVIIDALNNRRQRRELLLDLLKQGNLLACCSVDVTEVYAGMRPKEEPATEEFL
jgi:predicted nucleic acid-binding protein